MSDELVDIALLGLPVALHHRASEHQATLQRELDLVDAARDPQSAPSRLQALSEQLNVRFASMTEEQTAQLERAMANGDDTIDLHYRLPADVVDAVHLLSASLDEVDEFCRRGELLTLITPPDLLAYRMWFLGEFVRQIVDGAPPMPWSDDLVTATASPSASTPQAEGASATVAVRGDLDLAMAASLRAELVEHLDRGARDLVVDLSECGFVDSAGMSLLLTTRARCVALGGSLRIAGANNAVRQSMQMADVYDVLTGHIAS